MVLNESQAESHLSRYIGKVNLLYEIPLDKEDLHVLTAVIRRSIELAIRRGLDATDSVWGNVPHTAASFLVQHGIYCYEHGNYWDCILRSLQPYHVSEAEWGENFLSFVNKFGLEDFPFSKGHKYVSRILLHGGIPQYCLGDFFSNLIWPAVARADEWGFETSDVLEHWITSESRQLQTDKPVRRFISEGGSFAYDFISRCLDLARHVRTGGQSQDLANVLPSRVLSEFDDWLKKMDAKNAETHTNRTHRKPYISFDPLRDYAPSLILPAQTLDRSHIEQFIHWEVLSQDGFYKRKECQVNEISEGLNTNEIVLGIEPRNRYEVILKAAGSTLVKWQIDLFTNREWISIFDSYTFKKVPSNRIRHDHFFVLAPKDTQVGAGIQLTEKYRSLSGAWSNYQAAEYKFIRREASFITPQGTYLLEWLGASGTHELVGVSSEISSMRVDRQHKIFSNAAPILRLPRAWLGRNCTLHLSHCFSQGKITDVILESDDIRMISTEEACYSSINLARCFGGKELEYGKYLLAWRNLGNDFKSEFYIIPAISIVPIQIGSPFQHSIVDVHIPIESQVGLKVDQLEIEIETTMRQTVFHFVQTDYRPSVSFMMEISRSDHPNLEIPVTLEYPAIQASIVDMESDLGSTDATNFSLQRMEQCKDPKIFLRWGQSFNDASTGALVLKDPDEKIWQTASPIRRSAYGASFSLHEFTDTLRQYPFSKPTFFLEPFIFPISGELFSIPVLELSCEWETRNFKVDISPNGLANDALHVTFQWDGDERIRGRILRVYYLWGNSTKPIERLIPDGANTVSFTLSRNEMPPGEYRAYLDIIDDWALSTLLNVPAMNSPRTLDFCIEQNLWEEYLEAAPLETRYRAPSEIVFSLGGIAPTAKEINELFRNEFSKFQTDPQLYEKFLCFVNYEKENQQLFKVSLIEGLPLSGDFFNLLLALGVYENPLARNSMKAIDLQLRRESIDSISKCFPALLFWLPEKLFDKKNWVEENIKEWDVLFHNICIKIASRDELDSTLSNALINRLKQEFQRITNAVPIPFGWKSALDASFSRIDFDPADRWAFVILLLALRGCLFSRGIIRVPTDHKDQQNDWIKIREKALSHFHDLFSKICCYLEYSYENLHQLGLQEMYTRCVSTWPKIDYDSFADRFKRQYGYPLFLVKVRSMEISKDRQIPDAWFSLTDRGIYLLNDFPSINWGWHEIKRLDITSLSGSLMNIRFELYSGKTILLNRIDCSVQEPLRSFLVNTKSEIKLIAN